MEHEALLSAEEKFIDTTIMMTVHAVLMVPCICRKSDILNFRINKSDRSFLALSSRKLPKSIFVQLDYHDMTFHVKIQTNILTENRRVDGTVTDNNTR